MLHVGKWNKKYDYIYVHVYCLAVNIHLGVNVKMMDKKEFCSEPFQRVYQYLMRHMNYVALDNFSYVPISVEGNHLDCLQVFLK